MPTYYHHVPGRVRVRIPRLKTDLASAQEVQRAAELIPGVNSVKINRITGSVLVHYNYDSETSATTIIGLLRQYGMLPPPNRPPQPLTTQLGASVAKIAATYVIEAIIERLVAAVLLGLL